MGLGSAATANMAAVASIAGASELVRGDDIRWGYFAGKADLVLGKLSSAQLPDHAVTVAVSVANQAARLAVSADAARGRIFRDDDTKISYCLIAGGLPSNPAHWLPVGDAVVTLNDINGITSLGIALCGATTPALARAAMALANVADASGVDIAIQGNLILGNAVSNKLTIAVNALPGPMTVNASYRAGGATLYWALTSNADGTLALADVVGLPAALANKADLVGGKIPLSQLPAVVGSLTSSVSVANATAREAMTSAAATGVIVVQADDKSSWMLVAGGVPSNPLDWNQVGDAEVRVAEIVDAGVTGQQLLLAEDEFTARNALGLGVDEAITFASVYLGSGSLFFHMGAGVYRSLSKPTTLTGSGWVLPNRSGYLAYSPNADGALNGSDISGGNPTFSSTTTGAIVLIGIFTHNPGSSERWISGAFNLTQTVSSLTSNRSQTFPNGSGTYALVASSSGAIQISDVSGLTSALAAKASLVAGKVPLSQLPDSDLTNFSNGSGTVGQVAGNLVIGSASANALTIDVSGLSAPRTLLPPLAGSRLTSDEEVTPAKGLRTGRVISSDASSSLVPADFGTVVEVVNGIANLTFPLYGVMSSVLGACIDLNIRSASQAVSGNVLDSRGVAITSLPAGYYRVAMVVDSGSTARYTVQGYISRPLRESAADYAPTNYQPVSAWRSGGNASELGAQLAGLDQALTGQRGWYAMRSTANQNMNDGSNIISLSAGATVDAVQNCSLINGSEFAPSADGVWKLELSFWLCCIADSIPVPEKFPTAVEMQILNSSGSWVSYGDKFLVVVGSHLEPPIITVDGVDQLSLHHGTHVRCSAVIPFLVSGSGVRRRVRFRMNGINPPGDLFIGHGGFAQDVGVTTTLTFQAHRL